MTLDTTLLLAGIVAEVATVLLLLTKRAYRNLPIFFAYISWSLLVDCGQLLVIRLFPNLDVRQRIYLIQTIIDSIFQFCVLVELSMSVLRPVRSSLPRKAIFAVGLIIAMVCAAIWPFAKSVGFDQLSADGRLIVHFQQTFSVVRILFFLVLAGCSQLLSIGWRDRELQVATGLGFYSIIGMSVSLVHTGQPVQSLQYHLLDQLAAASYFCSLVYWLVSFAQKVPERREFTPQMQNFLLAVAGNARSARMAMDDSTETKRRK